MNIIESIELVTKEVYNNIHNLEAKKNRLTRSRMRRIIFKIRDKRLYELYDMDRALGVKAIISRQFQEIDGVFMDWNNFTTLWDIHPKNTLEVVKQGEWYRVGGGYDKKFERMSPTAFTHQG